MTDPRSSGEWRSIDEDPAPEPVRQVVCLGIPPDRPLLYRRKVRPYAGHAATIASALWRIITWGASATAHLAVFAILAGLVVLSMHDRRESLVEVGFSIDDGGRDG